MWLLDANMDVHLVSIVTGFSIPCDTAANRGWKELSNGGLVSAAASAGFTCILTRDVLLGEVAARALKAFPNFAVVVIRLPQQRWDLYREQFLIQWAEHPILPIAGKLTAWP